MTSARDDASTDDGVEREATAWFVRLNNPLATDEDRRAFRDWMAADPIHAEAYNEVRDLWRALDAPAAAMAASERRATPPALRRASRSFGFAAAMALSLSAAVGVAFWRDPGLLTRALADHATAHGARAEIALSDGSTVLLDGDSAINETISANARDVTLLRGRAYFDVTPDPARPFRVHAAALDVRVLGTGFAVDRDVGQVTVDHGSVDVMAGAASARLRDGEQISASGEGLGAPAKIDPAQAIAWRKGMIVLDAATLGDVFREIDRMSPGRMIALQPEILALRLSGAFRADDPNAMIEAMRHGLGLKTVSAPGIATLVYR